MSDNAKKEPSRKKAKDRPPEPALAPPPEGPASAGPLVFTPASSPEQKSPAKMPDGKAGGKAKNAAPATHSDRPKSLAERRRQSGSLAPAPEEKPQQQQAIRAPRRRASESKRDRPGRRQQRKPKTGLWLVFGVGLLIVWLAFNPKFRAALAPYLTPDAPAPELESRQAEAARLLTELGLHAEGEAADLESAIRQFQEMAGLKADGAVSDSLLEELRAIAGILGEAANEESLP